jgi:hypothetical protein
MKYAGCVFWINKTLITSKLMQVRFIVMYIQFSNKGTNWFIFYYIMWNRNFNEWVLKCFLIKVRYSDDKLIFSNGISNFFFNNFHMLFCFLLSSSLNNIPDNIKSSEDAHSFLKFVLIICTSADTSSLYFNY